MTECSKVLSRVHTAWMAEQVDRTRLHRQRQAERAYESHRDALRRRNVQNVLHALLLVERDSIPTAVARSSEPAVRIVMV